MTAAFSYDRVILAILCWATANQYCNHQSLRAPTPSAIASTPADDATNHHAHQHTSFRSRIHCRKKTEGKGLSSAVLLGLFKAKYDVMLVRS